jgi:hypothetical protein
MKPQINNDDAVSAIAMTPHGINAHVLAPHSELDSIRLTLLTLPDRMWGEGKGKHHLQQQLHLRLKEENAYFLDNPTMVSGDNDRWSEFMDDCIFFAVLHSVVTGAPIILIHPDQWGQLAKKKKGVVSPGVAPTLIPGVPTQSLS